MPLYDYECPREHRFEKRVPIAEMNEYQECPGHVVEPCESAGKPFKIVPCRAPSKRIPVPSSPPNIIIH